MSFPEYSEYLDSKVQWIGLLPSHWEAAPLKWQLIANDGGVWGSDPEEVSDTEVLRSTDQTVDGKWRVSDPAKRFLTSKEKASAALKAGDLVVTKSSGSSLHIGKTTLVTSEMELKRYCYGNFMQRLRVKKSLLPVVLWYLMNNQICRKQLDLLSNSTTGLANLNGSLLGELLIPVAPIEEQTQIARFLDHETAKIDALIREQERLIELLQEKRQVVISHAVTKGLDPDVPMKDSGVQWLGEVPAHWRVGKLRWYATIQGGVAKGKDYQDQKTVSLPYLRVANVQAGYVDLTEVKEIAVLESEIERYSLRHGDVLMNEGGDNDKLGRGTVWRAEIEPCLHQNHVFAIRPNGHLTPEWLAMFTQSSRARSYFFLNSKQSTNLASISSSNVMNLDLPMPSVDEQERILQFLESELQQFTDLQKQADKGIQLLLERRSALISAAVTGKIDVRNWQPPVDESAFDEEVRQAGMEVTA